MGFCLKGSRRAWDLKGVRTMTPLGPNQVRFLADIAHDRIE
jgi:hypothetical protein